MHNFSKESGQLTVVFDVSFAEEKQVIEDHIVKEECPFIYDLNGGNLMSFQWHFSVGEKTATLVEVLKSSDAWEELATQVIGTPVNVKFNEFFAIEKLTICGARLTAVEKK
tara:strand:+ start:349 stop:681 length:333 start_codon:yes stop_codon:yes gene_type:complete